IRNTLGMTYLYVGEPARAVKQLERALALRRQVLGYGHLDTLRSMINFGEACRAAGRLADAMLLFREATQRMGISREFYQLLGWKEIYPISQVERSREFGTDFIRCLNNL